MAMMKLVRGADGRMWTLRSSVEWSTPALSDDFEHDVAANRAPGYVLLGLLALFVVALFIWRPGPVVVPEWLLLILLLGLLFFPVRWLVRRPWTLVANTPGSQEDETAERWVGIVHGAYTIRQTAAKVARDIEVYSKPNADGPLQLVD
ncbi:MAG TPA: DUF983 domain-containing protein [Pseudonocardiaceae bacterium]|jgi:hypothetical protein|nr:DUF983 domain-containing protein [Pseudonocardiaceae bacterium]